MKTISDGVDVVIHTAGQPGVPSSVRIPKEDFSINAYGTLNVLECTRKVSPKAAFIYCSTNKVYGENVDKILWNIGGGPKNTTSLLEFLDVLDKKLGLRPKITFSNWRPSDQKVYISDINKIKKNLTGK